MNNPMLMLLQQMINGNPNMRNNPAIQNAFQNSNNIPELKNIAENYCNQQGIKLSDVQNYIQSNPLAILQMLGMK